ncbi:hypothetical protein AB1207_12010 [Kineococcus endophyticus]|uniref:TFIIS-type domain-containing protein n=1 Tax=Kineococcus endophyticus TaxID=1181883 RepID=A0ABV3P776_9ACTN
MPAANAPRASRRPRAARTAPPLGSLTQAAHRETAVCAHCGSERVTQLSMSLTDGTPVQFVSCHVCEERSWMSAAGPITVDGVLERSRKR